MSGSLLRSYSKLVPCFCAVAAVLLGIGCSESDGPVDSAAGSSGAGRPGSGGAAGASGSKASAAGTSSAGASVVGGAPSGGASGGGTGLAGSAGSAGMTASGGASGTGGVHPAGGSANGGASGMGGAHSGGAAGSGGSSGGSTVLGATPPMGWNSWNAYNCNGLNETVVKSMADAFVTTGMKAVGYQYVNLDDCWMDGRDSSGKLKWNATKFPSGIPALAEYIHAKGLKIGIYETPNTKTCAGLYGGYAPGVGSVGHETTDAQTFASWGIDYLKYDKCQGALSGFAVMRDALKATGRPIFYSINPADQGPYCTPTNCSLNLPTTANMWRIGFDISASWKEVIRLIDENKEQYAGAGPGHWNDPDMLEVGNGLNDTEGRAHFSMWAIMAAPLITGNDLTKMSATTKATLTNAEVIAVDQDPLGKQGRVVAKPGTDLEVWSKELSGSNTRAVALFNRSSASASITVQWSQIGLPAGAATVRDLWAAKDLGPSTGSYTATSVPSHSVVMLKIVSAP
ncbi:MAG TPA: glycoside hydrolase family 27 protein [Polyangiaceae bacterium]|nr:glycoside hydrolase family 27 protein [Polyangiaceae bacterium]